MSTPEGWYDDGSGRTRWWDGVAWTEYYADTYERQVAGDLVTPEESAAAEAAAEPASTVRLPASYLSRHAAAPAPPSAAPAGFPLYGWGGVALIVGGGIVFLIGRGIYYSDPYYNNTTDPVGLGTMLVGGVIALIGIIITRTAFRNRG